MLFETVTKKNKTDNNALNYNQKPQTIVKDSSHL